MRNLILLVLLLFAFRINAIEIDSVQREKLIHEGRTELCNLLEHNTHAASPGDRKYVVVIDGDPNAINYTVEKNVQGNTEDILSQEAVDSINATLARTYSLYGIEMYVIMMKTFNFVVKSPLPNLPSSTQLFTHHLYDEESNIAELRAIHQQLTNEITYNTFSARGRDCLVYSRADYTGAYVPGKIGTWTLSKRIPYYAQTSTYPKLAELTDYYYDRIRENPNVINAGLELSLRNAAKEFWESAKFMALKNEIMTTLHTQQMSQIFQQFNESVDYQNLTEAERIHALGVFAGYPMFDNGMGQQERYACKIIENTPKEQVSGFLTQLSQVSPLNTTIGFIGDKLDQALIITLIDKMDDVGPGGDNYTRMMRGLTSIAISDENFATSHMPQTSQQWLDRRIYWDDWSAMETAPIGTHDYDVTLSSDAKVQVTHKVVKRWDSDTSGRQESIRYTEVWENYDPYQLDPFDLVVFTNRSSLGMLQVAGAAPDQPFLAPAIFLKYADDKAFNTNAITVTAIAIDIVAIATGPFAIGGALAAGNVAIAAYEALQLMGSVANLVANQNTSPEFQEAVTTFNIVVGGWGLANIAVAGTKYAVGYIDAALNGTIRPVPLTTASEYCSKYDAVANWNGVDEATRTRMGKLRQVLGEEVVAGQALSFIAHTGEELRLHLNSIPIQPVGVTYSGNLYKSIGKQAELSHDALPDVISPYSVESAWGRYDTPGESAMYYSQTLSGNETELSHYGDWSAFSTYEYADAQVSNLLDLTSESTRRLVGIDFASLVKGESDKMIAYEFTNVIGTWARSRGYKGIIFPGARGMQDYTNIIIFEQIDVTHISTSCTMTKIK